MTVLLVGTVLGLIVVWSSLFWGPVLGADGTQSWCLWDRPRSGLVRDTIYVDGGSLGYIDVTSGQVIINDQPYLYSINLTETFSTSLSNVSEVFNRTATPGSNLAPNMKNGHFLSNDYEFVLYGGSMEDTDTAGIPADNWALGMNLYKHDPVGLQDAGQWKNWDLDGVTRNVAEGAYVSVPSENLGFVFMGTRTKTWSNIAYPGRDQYKANALSSQLITVDLKTMNSETWSNDTIPDDVPERAGAEIAWIPAGKRGTLVAIGGTRLTANDSQSGGDFSSSEEKILTADGQSFVSTVSLYDVDGQNWYTQETTGDIPGPMAMFCSVVASSQDGSSHQIYVYGGYDGTESDTDSNVTYYDDVHVLSIPSFVWTKVYDGESSKARRGHVCHKVADSQMIVIGGQRPLTACVQDFLRVFDLNKLEWLESYDPGRGEAKYEVPDSVISAIGGSATGGATATPSSWNSTDLKDLLSVKYTTAITTWWPFPSAVSESPSGSPPSSTATSTSTAGGGGSSLPSYVPPLLGAILGLLVVISVLCGVLLFLRRRRNIRKRLASDSGASTVKRNRRTWSWIMGANGEEKDGHDFEEPTHTAEHNDPFDGSTAVANTPLYEQPNPLLEAEGAQVYELPGTTVAQELSGTTPKKVKYADDEVQEIGGEPIHSPTSPTSPTVYSPSLLTPMSPNIPER